MNGAPGGAQLNPIEVERELRRLSDLLEQRTGDLRKESVVAAKAEANYKQAWAKATLAAAVAPGSGRNGQTAVDERKAKAYIACADELVTRLTSAAIAEATRESCRSIRAQLSSLQTLSANQRDLSR